MQHKILLFSVSLQTVEQLLQAMEKLLEIKVKDKTTFGQNPTINMNSHGKFKKCACKKVNNATTFGKDKPFDFHCFADCSEMKEI